jgi:2-polyprenyl-6-methoxyphenol hydroxylase-like FAD-dependent oxidoreductase
MIGCKEMSRSSQLQHVTIVGGSLAGLMHALTILTHSPSTKVTILERSPTALLHNQGAGVVAGAETQAFFSRYVCPGHEFAVPSKQRLYLDRKGAIVEGSVQDKEQRMTSWDTLYRLLRWRVDGMHVKDYIPHDEQETIMAKLPQQGDHGKATYQYACTVKSVQDSASLKVHWTDKSGNDKETTTDLVIAADGASSSIRRSLLPAVQRTYAGYVALRGTIPEADLSPSAAKVFSEKFAFFHSDGLQILAYLIPGENGTLEPGKRLANWVWYRNQAQGSAALAGLMTDQEGTRHHVTLPVNAMKDSVWTQQKEHAKDSLPPQFAELVVKTNKPFVQSITDNISPQNDLCGGRVLLVGDSLAGFRPHTAASTGQAAYDALTLGEWLDGTIDRDEYSRRIMDFATKTQKHGVMLGERSQFGRHPFAA